MRYHQQITQYTQQVRERVLFCTPKREIDLKRVRKSIREMYSDRYDVDSWVFSYVTEPPSPRQ